jgi:hypothetical protein
VASRQRTAVWIDDLSRLGRGALLERWSEHFDRPPPDYSKSEFLVRAIAWQSQVDAYGGLSPALLRHLHRIAEGKESSSPGGAGHRHIKPGTRLIRTWHGQTYDVHVLEDGYEWNGRRYRSLSAIAREITGSRWNGPRFFGLTGKENKASGD